MHTNFPFNELQIIWTLLFASQLVLLVVLIGRERTQRFWWFTAGIVVAAVRELINLILTGRISSIIFSAIYYTLAILSVLLMLMALIEIVRNLFTNFSLLAWALLASGISLISAVTLYFLIPWSAQTELNFHTQLGMLSILNLVGVCGQIAAAIAAVIIGLVALFFATHTRRFWNFHALKVLAGFTTYSLILLSTVVIVQWISKLAHNPSVPESDYAHINTVIERLINLPYITMIIVQIWWIRSLWPDETTRAGT